MEHISVGDPSIFALIKNLRTLLVGFGPQRTTAHCTPHPDPPDLSFHPLLSHSLDPHPLVDMSESPSMTLLRILSACIIESSEKM